MSLENLTFGEAEPLVDARRPKTNAQGKQPRAGHSDGVGVGGTTGSGAGISRETSDKRAKALEPGGVDLRDAVNSFIDPLDANLLALQELAAVLGCSDRRFLPARLLEADRAILSEQFAKVKALAGRR